MVRKGSFLPTHLIPGASLSSPEYTGGGSLANLMTSRDTMKIIMVPIIIVKTPIHVRTDMTVRRLQAFCPMALKCAFDPE
jgi:hypothetical protein